MGITGLLPFIDKASRRTNISEFSGCTVAIDSYCWLHKGTYACADKLIRGEQTDMHIRYCMKYVTMLLSNNIKPILVFDGRHLPAKAMTESKRRESRDISKKRAAELLSLGQTEEARKYMRRGVDITHSMALSLIKECRKRNVDCIVAPYEADAQLAYLNIKNIAHIVITEDSDLILFGCTKALKKLPGFLKKSSLVVTDEYRESFMKAEATFKHQYVYDPLERKMVRLTEPDDEEIEQAFCVNAGELLDPKIAFELALGNLDPFTLKKMDDWHPDHSRNKNESVKTNNWKEKGVSSHPSIWSKEFLSYLDESYPWRKKEKKSESILPGVITRPRKVVNLVSKYVPETQDQSLSIETLSNMYCTEPAAKKQKIDCDNELSETSTHSTEYQHNRTIDEDNSPNQLSKRNDKSPILENKERSFKKLLKNGNCSILKKLSRFPRTVLDNNVVESKFFSSNEEVSTNEANISKESITIEESPEHCSRNPFKKHTKMGDEDSQKENFECNSSPVRPDSPILEPSPKCKRPIIMDNVMDEPIVDNMASEDSVIDNTYPMETLITPTASQSSFGASQKSTWLSSQSQPLLGSQFNKQRNLNGFKKTAPKVNGVKKSPPLPSNQPTLLSKFGFQKKPALKR
ncbi:hypothetical protein HF086_000905 [Spodoptera exigua]|uniref:Exonuclease 1 n=1 Tax=Spodoptera exigua TaxID=7107 RepID=A0A922MMA2_SPOEX|nr:hypothetical protein HF086_000905 [Spodoptera exigua]